MGMENLMKALMQSAMQSPGQNAPQQSAGGDLLSGVLGGLMGGGQQAMPQQGGGADLLSGALGALMGGGAPQGGNSGDAMLGSLEQIIGGQPGQGQQLGMSQMASGNMGMMGGTGMSDPVMGMLQPVVSQVAAKANIPPQIAMVVASVALHYLLSSHPSTSVKAPMDLGSVMQELQSGGLSANTMHQSGMVNDVMQATGLNKQGAQSSLETVFQMLAGHVQG